MNRELLRKHCEKICKIYEWAPASNAYMEHKLVLDLLEQTRWIPISERLPEKSGEYWCTFRGTNLTGTDYYTTEADAKKLFDDPEEYDVGWRSQNVIAWMPLPTVYRESEDKEC